MYRFVRLVLLVAAFAGMHARARDADLYDPSVLRTFALTFHDANWETLLRSNYASQTYILADLVVEGVTYPDVGVRIRGNTSYTALPSGSQKFSLKLKIDYAREGQALFGYDTLNLNNGFHDPTFSREIVYNNYVARFIPNPRANHVVVTLNGANWGVYNNVQQGNKSMLRNYFSDTSGLRIGCANNPNGPGLAYNGLNASGYGAYEIQDDGGLADPYASLIAVTNALSNGSLADWQAIDEVFAIDPSIWSVVLENLLTDDDSYVNKGCDFATYTDPRDGRMHLIQRDANESFTAPTWSPTLNFNAANKPFLSRVLSVAELRQRYMAHYRAVLAQLDWNTFGPLFQQQRELIDAAVQADPKKLYTYQAFQNNFTASVTLPGGGPAGGTVPGLQAFVAQRANALSSNAELAAAGPAISALAASAGSPSPADAVWITATVAAGGSPVSGVVLYYRADPAGIYRRTAMADDGASGDGAAGDGVYGALLPIAAASGQTVAYYVEAIAQNAYQSRSYFPVLAERGPQSLVYGYGVADDSPLRITEFMYSGAGGEFIEFTNMSDAAVDMAGWSFDDDHALPGAFPLDAFGTVQPGESVVLAEAAAEAFRSDWSLPAGVKIIGNLGLGGVGNNLGRNDGALLFNAANELADRLDYGDQTYAGTIRAQNASGQAPCAALGANTIADWTLSAAGDDYASFAAASGDIGTPGSYARVGCAGVVDDIVFADGFESAPAAR